MANNNHFELTLDTLAPTGSIEGLGMYEKENKALVFTHDGATFKKVWFDKEAEPTKDCEGYKNATWMPAAEAVESAFIETGMYYYHVVFMDDVNNESDIYTLGWTFFDQDKPVVSNVVLQDSRGDKNTTNSLELHYSFSYSDGDGSGVSSVTIRGTDFETFTISDLTSEESYSGVINLSEGAGDGDKQIYVTVYDRAGNASLEVSSNPIVLDRELDKPTLLIQDSANNNLPGFINYNVITTKLLSQEDNIVAYQVWEGAADAYPAEWMSQEAGNLNYVNNSFALSSGDGEKVIHARIKDTAGNIKQADSRSVTIDTVAPTASLEIDRTIISKVESFDKANITIEYADERSGIAKYSLVRINSAKEETVVVSGTSEVINNYEVVVGALADGLYEYRLDVEDKAGNKFSSNVVYVTFDTTAPSLSITPLNEWYTKLFNVSVSYSDANDFGSMYAWVNTVADDTNIPAGAKGFRDTTTISSDLINYGTAEKPTESADNYMHICLFDEVGNASYAHAKFGFDSVAPVITELKFTKAAYSSEMAEIRLSYEEATSAIVDSVVRMQMNVSGDITNGTAGEWEPFASTRAIILDKTTDGMKSVTVTIKDGAGLTATKTIECELDTTVPAPSIELYNAENTEIKPNYSPLDSFSVRIKVDGDDSIGGCEYQIYGDFAATKEQEQGVVFDDANGWKEFVRDSGQDYMTISGLFCTVPDGKKEVYVKVRDNAGNILKDEDGKETIIKASFIYDTTLPKAAIYDIDHNRISKVHSLRIRNSECSFSDCYADECRFTFKPDSPIQAYKVCAYMNKDAILALRDENREVEQANIAAQPHIVPTGYTYTDANGIERENKSINMFATNLSSDAEVKVKIVGSDFEAALGGSDENKVDGARWVVVYVQDLAGQWSVAAEFEN